MLEIYKTAAMKGIQKGEGEDNHRENNVQIVEESDDETEASRYRNKVEVDAASRKTNQIFHLSLECSGGTKCLLLKK